MKFQRIKMFFAVITLSLTWPLQATIITYDANVTNNAIFGSGNINGFFTVLQHEGIELGLRAKLRHNAIGAPENTFNSNGDGTYSFDAGVAPTQSFPTAVWSFEWSINSDFAGLTGMMLDDFMFSLSLDSDPSSLTSFVTFDLFDTSNGAPDHSIGNNSTAQGAGSEATDIASFNSLIANNNLAQNSWKPHWFIPGFDPTVDATYDIALSASSKTQSFASFSNTIQVIVGNGGSAQSVPEPSTIAILALGVLGLASRRYSKP